MQVYLLPPGEVTRSPRPLAADCFEQLRAGFDLQSTTVHRLTPDPESAALILAPIRNAGYGPCFEALRSSSVYRRHGDKLVAYSPEEGQVPGVRGLYPSVSHRWLSRGWALPAHYISAHIHQFSFTREEIQNKNILFSFVGSSRTHPIRERIVRWQHPRGVVIDSSAKTDKEYWWEKPNKKGFLDSFREVTRRSKFVICPRGVSASSIRLFEAMEAGAVPVIVSDDLELPLGPRWEEFSLRVPERDLDVVPKVVERWEERAVGMGAAARRAWESYFSPGASVGSIIGWAQLLLRQPHRRPVRLQLQEYANPKLLRAKARYFLGK